MRSKDLFSVLDIVSDLASLPPDAQVRRAHFLTATTDLLGATSSLLCHVEFGPTGQYHMSQPSLHGFAPSAQTLLADYFRNRYEVDPCGYIVDGVPGEMPVVSRNDLLPDNKWYTTDHYNLTRRPLGLDEGLYSRFRTGDATFGVCFMREHKAARFRPRERQLFSLLNRYAQKFLLLSAPLRPIDTLAPRYRAVAERLLGGDSAKQAALALGLSVHTVIQYTKHLHKHFNVSSRAELLLKLLSR